MISTWPYDDVMQPNIAIQVHDSRRQTSENMSSTASVRTAASSDEA